MDKKKIPTGVRIVVIVIIAITVGVLVWKYEKSNEQIVSQTPDIIPQQNRNKETQGAENNQENILPISEPIENWKIYQNNKYNFKFKHPSQYSVEARETSTTGEYFIKENSNNIIHIRLTKWKGYIIKKGTPGTFWEKIAQSNWQYFSSNIGKISSGECSSEALKHVSGPTTSEAPSKCNIESSNNYIKVETESYISYFTKNVEMRWDIKNENDLEKKITSTLTIN